MTRKTTIYLPDELKAALEREAARRGDSQAAVVRQAIAAIVSRPRPTTGLFDAGPFADSIHEHLVGFGER